MKIHAIQTGTVSIRPNQRLGKGKGVIRLINTLTDKRWTEPLPIYAWVIEHPEGVILIDTGESARAMEPGYFPSWHPYFKNVLIEIKPEQEVGPQLQKIGIHPKDVRWVIMTHLHTDHAGGLHHFPHSEIIIMERAFRLATGFMGKMLGFLPHRFPTWLNPTLINLSPEPFGPFDASWKLTEDVIIVPTPGHTQAHISVILKDNGIHYFFAGDASYTQQFMLDQQIDGVSLNGKGARRTLRRIRKFAQENPTVYLPSHDPQSAVRLENKETVNFP